MIYLQELLDDLAYGELHGIKLGNSSEETLDPASYPRVISATNIALHKIYTELHLREKRLKLHQQAGVTRYFLRSGYSAEVGSFGADAYLEESDNDPFENDVIKVTAVYDSENKKVRLNDKDYPCDMFTPDFDVIDIAAPSTTLYNADQTQRTALDTFTLVYRARYPKIVLKQNFNPEKFPIYCPEFIKDPLLIYIAYKMFRKPVKIAKGEVSPSQSLIIEFRNAMARIKASNVELNDDTERNTFESKGWV
jgi:hypothetical protein